MTGLPGEVVYVLIFAAVMLVRYLWQQRTQVQPWEEALARAPQPTESTATPPPEATLTPQPGAASPGGHAAASRPRPPPAPRPSSDFGASGSGAGAFRAQPQPQPRAVFRASRRFSRQALFGDRRRTQDAMVASVILGPCRSSSPYDADR
jgi:hypothetical protein